MNERVLIVVSTTSNPLLEGGRALLTGLTTILYQGDKHLIQTHTKANDRLLAADSGSHAV